LGPVFLGSLVTGLAGFAFSAVAASLLLHWLSPVETVALLLTCSITIQLLAMTQLWRHMDWNGSLRLSAGGLCGVPLGTALLHAVDARTFAFGVGAFLAAYATIMLLAPRLTVRTRGRAADSVVGFLGGIVGGALAFPGAVPSMWCTLRGLP